VPWDGEIRIVTFSQIIDDYFGKPGILDDVCPLRINRDAIPRVEHKVGLSIDGAGAGRDMSWVLDIASADGD
jgi:hypothetical protein